MSDYSYFCGIDLAKNHFSIHAVDQNANVILHKSVTRPKLLTTIENMPLMRIGVEGKTRRGSVAAWQAQCSKGYVVVTNDYYKKVNTEILLWSPSLEK
ncbi:hypothetical protein VCRA2122O339_190014 [Vibrio crassostreae]|nr:hypothetical protein VCRA2120E331_90083 [Vibrio crassostreae]CAK3154236.1 hypothetical protein VCRA2120E330_100082 [Vibrio crassostreae]CAK3301872.1 hypothetical protein VCRA2122O339_190014 [Vibrio crassostreae]CAK3645537.1 hypothetical protein VCRA2127O345_90083 [Vibrio crassostreae]CAK3682499.1 hypothetical protein VCRA2122O338_90083 [Vibrio crassostreae]